MSDLLNTFTIGILFFMFGHYLFLYIGRPSEKINLYFSFFIFFVFIYIFFASNLFLRFVEFTEEDLIDSIKTVVSSICSFAFIYFGSKSLIVIFEYNLSLKVFRIVYFLHSILTSFVILTISVFGIIFYKKYFLFYNISISIFLMFFVFIYFTFWFIKEKKYKEEPFIFIFIVFFFIMLNIATGRILNFYYNSKLNQENFLPLGISFYIFAYFLAYKINEDNSELIEKKRDLEDLTVNLEKLVLEKTLELKKANEEIEDMIKQKTYFFINLAHETKTPLTLISNYIDKYIKKQPSLDPDIQIIKQNIDKLIGDMLNFFDIEKIQRGEIFYNNELITNFSLILENKLILFKETSTKKNIVIESKIESHLFIKADPEGIERIISNLIDNAIKYSKDGGSIKVMLESIDNKIHFNIIDNGEGISNDDIDNIFLPYFQKNTKAKSSQGIGFGLYIVKMIVKSIGGDIKISSIKNIETKIEVTFNKYEKIKEQENIIDEKNRENNTKETDKNLVRDNLFKKQKIYLENKNGHLDIMYDKSRYNILVVEDNTDLLNYIVTILNESYNVFFATNGKKAMELLDIIPKPHIIISDIMMDQMDGYTFFDEVSKKREFSDISIIFLTAKSSIDEKIEGLRKGAIDYIFKPFVIEELILRIRSLIKNHSLKKKFYENEKFASVGKLVANITHEIANPVFGIKGPLDFVRSELNKCDIGNNKNVIEAFEYIFKNLIRIEDLIKNLKLLYYNKELVTKKTALKDLFDSILNFFIEKYKDKILFDLQIAEGLKSEVNEQAFNIIITNLISNAIDAILPKNGGTIQIFSNQIDGKTVIKISDNGVGIPEDKIKFIFDPFWTSKDIGSGIGMGLYIVKDLIHKIGWEINVVSELGKGTIFVLKEGEINYL